MKMIDRYLYKGKRVDNGEWVIGDLSQWNDGDMYICKQHRQFDEEYEVIPETVGQCTGLKDKNGKLIFEGDVVERYSYYDDIWGFSYTAECYGVIVWNTNDYCWNIKTNNELIPFNDYAWDISMVVGSIHDNPELLEVKE